MENNFNLFPILFGQLQIDECTIPEFLSGFIKYLLIYLSVYGMCLMSIGVLSMDTGHVISPDSHCWPQLLNLSYISTYLEYLGFRVNAMHSLVG